MTELEKYFSPFRNNITGIDREIDTPYGKKPLVYADWVASGRLYTPIENRISKEIGPMVGNTHSESTATGKAMTDAYHLAQKIVKKHCNANEDDRIIFEDPGFQSLLSVFMLALWALSYFGRPFE